MSNAIKVHEGACEFKRVKVRKHYVFRCMIPGCTKYKLPAFIVNSMCKCFLCGNEFVVTQDLARRERLRCSNCVVHRKPQIKAVEANEFLNELNVDSDDNDNSYTKFREESGDS